MAESGLKPREASLRVLAPAPRMSQSRRELYMQTIYDRCVCIAKGMPEKASRWAGVSVKASWRCVWAGFWRIIVNDLPSLGYLSWKPRRLLPSLSLFKSVGHQVLVVQPHSPAPSPPLHSHCLCSCQHTTPIFSILLFRSIIYTAADAIFQNWDLNLFTLVRVSPSRWELEKAQSYISHPPSKFRIIKG